MKKFIWLTLTLSLLVGVAGFSPLIFQSTSLAQTMPEPYLKPPELLVNEPVNFDQCWDGTPNGMEPWI